MIWRGYVTNYGGRARIMRLYCDAPRRSDQCEKAHDFPDFKDLSLKDWLLRNGWRTIHRGGKLFDHYCPACALISRTSAAYQERIHA